MERGRAIHRHAETRVLEALRDTRVVYVQGARQVGKSTLVRSIAQRDGRAVLNLDDEQNLEAAASDPVGFLSPYRARPVVIDEVQRVPDLLLGIKLIVDRADHPGHFLLTGSTYMLATPGLPDTLAGRIELVTLAGLSQGEFERLPPSSFVERAFAGNFPAFDCEEESAAAYAPRIAAGGYPEAARRNARSRHRWFESYVTTLLQDDLPAPVRLERADQLPQLLRMVAAQAGGLAVVTRFSRDLEVSTPTTATYLRLLETLYLTTRIPAWTPGLARRGVRAPKLYVCDSGLHLHLLDAGERSVGVDQRVTGPAVENFCVAEILKQVDVCKLIGVRASHYRDKDQVEVDLVLERRGGDLVGIEVKAAATVRRQDFRGLRRLATRAGSRFQAGVLLYAGTRTLPFGNGMWAVPIAALWRMP